ncbi:MAG: hypothetical protein QOJ96_3816 [Alphaproteobacteria bacterium]|jgi:type IV secretory pathway VirB10-like protein|nr:hypothetical protein [Alphaproteobacteria bacterium]
MTDTPATDQKTGLEIQKLTLELSYIRRNFWVQAINSVLLSSIALLVFYFFQRPQLEQMESTRLATEKLQIVTAIIAAQGLDNEHDKKKVFDLLIKIWPEHTFLANIAESEVAMAGPASPQEAKTTPGAPPAVQPADSESARTATAREEAAREEAAREEAARREAARREAEQRREYELQQVQRARDESRKSEEERRLIELRRREQEDKEKISQLQRTQLEENRLKAVRLNEACSQNRDRITELERVLEKLRYDMEMEEKVGTSGRAGRGLVWRTIQNQAYKVTTELQNTRSSGRQLGCD